MSTIIFYGLAAVLLALSLFKSPAKTRLALKRAWQSFENLLPLLLFMLVLLGLVLAFLDENAISRWFGPDSGLAGILGAGALGSALLIPGFIAFPMSADLIRAGAGYAQISMFMTCLLLVGVITFPLEKKCFGLPLAVGRNILAFIHALIISLLIGLVL